MDVEKELKEIEAIRFAAESYMIVGGNPKKLLVESAEWLYNCYEATEDLMCLKAAKQIIKTYVRMGLLYDAAKDVFDKIMSATGIAFDYEFPKGKYPQKVIKCKVTPIREILGYWTYSDKKAHNAEWVAGDILRKVSKKECGCFFYEKKEGIPSFELLVLEEDAYLMDLERGRVYVFEKECKGE